MSDKYSNLEKVPFRSYTLDEDKELKEHTNFTVKLNLEEQATLKWIQNMLEQDKASTAMKQCLEISAYVLHDRKMMAILKIIFENKRKNKRMGLTIFDN